MDNVEVLDLGKEKRKKPKTKGVIVLIILIVIGLVVGYFLYTKNDSNKKLEDKIEVASVDYFEKYMSTNDSASTYVVTLDMLQDANNKAESYGLSGLENCQTDSTLARITINYKTGKPKNIEVELKC